MELVNVRHGIGKIDETLEIDFKEENEIIAQLTIVKDYLSLEKIDTSIPQEEALKKIVLPNIDPFYQTINITTQTDKDSYTESIEEIEKSHQSIVGKVGGVLKSITSIDPVYTRDDAIPEGESTVEYSARLITNIDVIATIMKFLYQNNISIEEIIKIKDEEDESQIKKENIHRI